MVAQAYAVLCAETPAPPVEPWIRVGYVRAERALIVLSAGAYESHTGQRQLRLVGEPDDDGVWPWNLVTPVGGANPGVIATTTGAVAALEGDVALAAPLPVRLM